MGKLVEWLYLASGRDFTTFRVVFRIVLSSADLLSAFLLAQAFGGWRPGSRIAAAYLLCPATCILSAYHGNTDPWVACAILAAVVLLSRERFVLAGAVFGLSLSIKWVGVAAAPFLALSPRSWNERLKFGLAAVLAAWACYAPWLLRDPGAVYQNVFRYHGQLFQSGSGQPIWGTRIWLGYLAVAACMGAAVFLFAEAWARRRENGREVGGRDLSILKDASESSL